MADTSELERHRAPPSGNHRGAFGRGKRLGDYLLQLQTALEDARGAIPVFSAKRSVRLLNAVHGMLF